MAYTDEVREYEGSEIESPEVPDINDVMALVDEGGTDVLTEEEFAEYSSYVDDHYTSTDSNDHLANLAEHIDDHVYLNVLAQDIIEWVDTDLNSREEWEKKEARGIRLLGVSTNTVGGAKFKGASKVTHPLLIEACVQFQARAIAEMWPSSGPVKTVVVGDVTDEGKQQAERVEGYMNYQYQTEMPGAFEEEDKMLFRLPVSGSCFKKTVYDPLVGTQVSRFIESSVMIVPYSATSLQTAVRFTEKYEEIGNDHLKKVAGGIYRSIKISDPDTTNDMDTDVEKEIDDTEGRQFVEYEGDHPYTRYECYCYLDIPGFEDVDQEGNLTGVSLPYVVTVCYDNQVVLSIRRNWKQGDVKKMRRVYYTHYRFLPGLGFYGYGLIHTIGGLAESATGALRGLLDAAGLANSKGGYKSRDARIPGGDIEIGMGQWPEVDLSPEEMKDAFFPFKYDEPSQTLFNLLGALDEYGRRFASTTENMVGEASNNGPVGTTLALIEQGSKVFSGIHLRLHQARAIEFKILSELNAEYLPDEYPYSIPGESRFVKSLDFDERVDVIPVSDPNIISNTQRIAKAQSVLELANSNPELYDVKEANRGMLESMHVANISELMPDQDEIMPADPVTEMAMILRGEPIQAFREQDHEAHQAVHQAIFLTLDEDSQERIVASYTAHMAEHKAFDVVLHFEEVIGVQITPENEPMITQMAAQAAQVYVSEKGGIQNEDPNSMQEEEEKRKNASTVAQIRRDDLERSAKIKRDDDTATAEIERAAMKEIKDNLGKAAVALGLEEETPGT